MELRKRLRVDQLKLSLEQLNKPMPSAEEVALRDELRAELEALVPARPPYPTRTNDLNCTREELVEGIADLTKRCETTLRILGDETQPELRKQVIRSSNFDLSLLEDWQNRLVRWEQLRTYKLWEADEQLKLNGPARPNKIDDLNCDRQVIINDIARTEPLAQNTLRLLSDPDVPEATKEQVKWTDYHYREFVASKNRLLRFDMLQERRVWESNREQA